MVCFNLHARALGPVIDLKGRFLWQRYHGVSKRRSHGSASELGGSAAVHVDG